MFSLLIYLACDLAMRRGKWDQDVAEPSAGFQRHVSPPCEEAAMAPA